MTTRRGFLKWLPWLGGAVVAMPKPVGADVVRCWDPAQTGLPAGSAEWQSWQFERGTMKSTIAAQQARISLIEQANDRLRVVHRDWLTRPLNPEGTDWDEPPEVSKATALRHTLT